LPFEISGKVLNINLVDTIVRDGLAAGGIETRIAIDGSPTVSSPAHMECLFGAVETFDADTSEVGQRMRHRLDHLWIVPSIRYGDVADGRDECIDIKERFEAWERLTQATEVD